MIAVSYTDAGQNVVTFEGLADRGDGGAVAVLWPEHIRDSFVNAYGRWRTDPDQRQDAIDIVSSTTACEFQGDRYRYLMSLHYRRRPRQAEPAPAPAKPAPIAAQVAA